jgi:hypothetical protein
LTEEEDFVKVPRVQLLAWLDEIKRLWAMTLKAGVPSAPPSPEDERRTQP